MMPRQSAPRPCAAWRPGHPRRPGPASCMPEAVRLKAARPKATREPSLGGHGLRRPRQVPAVPLADWFPARAPTAAGSPFLPSLASTQRKAAHKRVPPLSHACIRSHHRPSDQAPRLGPREASTAACSPTIHRRSPESKPSRERRLGLAVAAHRQHLRRATIAIRSVVSPIAPLCNMLTTPGRRSPLANSPPPARAHF
jgi:hypothetical protein